MNKAQLFARNNDFIAHIGLENSDYLPLPRNQLSKGNSFIFSVLACIEIAYGLLTGTRLLLSAEQVTKNLYNFYNGDEVKNLWIGSYCINYQNQSADSGNPLCVLGYIQHKGIMSEYDFPYQEGKSENKYDSRFIMPLNVTDIDSLMILPHENGQYKIVKATDQGNTITNNTIEDIIRNMVSRFQNWYSDVPPNKITPIVAYVCSSLLKVADENGIINEVDTTCEADQLVVITALGTIDSGIYFEIINSYGKDSGDEGKYYLNVSYDGIRFINNGQIFSHWTFLQVLHDPEIPFRLSNAYDQCPNCKIEFPTKRKSQYSFIYISSFVILGILGVLLIIQVIITIVKCTR